MYKTVPQNTYYQASFGHPLIQLLRRLLHGYVCGPSSTPATWPSASRSSALLSPEAGMYYRKKISISQGGTKDAMDLVKDYLGRDPKLDSFLERNTWG